MNADASRAKNSNSELARRGQHCPAQHRQSSSAPTADVRRANVFPEKISFSVDNRLACIQGVITNYEYDRDSALSARSRFLDLLSLLQVDAGISKINVIAHSMGNLVVLDALASSARSSKPHPIDELIMAAPDIDQIMFKADPSDIAKVVGGMTLYASSSRQSSGSRSEELALPELETFSTESHFY